MTTSAAAETATVVSPAASSSDHIELGPHVRRRETLVGVLLGVLSALCYTGTNIALRGVTFGGDADWAMWVTCMKSLPGAVAAWLLLGGRAVRGLPTLPPAQVCFLLLGTGLVVQGCGNLLFQWSLAMCGLALAVPTVFATLMLTGALLGRFWLGEAVTVRSAVAMGLLMAAIGLLSLGANAASAALPPGPPDVSPRLWVLAGIALAGVAGVFYGTLGVIIRHSSRRSIPLPAILALISTTGVLGLGIPAMLRLGSEILHLSPAEFGTMLLAGTLNAVAFFAIAGSLRRIPVVQVNLLNASQAALCALGGVLVYQEPLTGALVAGTGLTIFGLMLMSPRSRPRVG